MTSSDELRICSKEGSKVHQEVGSCSSKTISNS
jgi:hypothetical protein